jgi:hypothetical protein
MVFPTFDPALQGTIIVLLIILVVLGFALIYHHRAMAGRVPSHRPLPALDILKAALGRCAETGRAIHISPGAGTIGNRETAAETIVGLLAAERVTSEAALKGAPIVASSNDAIAHLALRGILRQAYRRAGQAQDYNPMNVQLLAHEDAMTYAVAVMGLHTRQRLEGSQFLGSFGHEFLLFGEDNAQRGLPQLAGTTSTSGLPLMILSTPDTLIGEEVFAAEAYLTNDTAPQARLMTQDSLRTAIIILIILGIIYSNIVGPLNALDLLPELPMLPVPGIQ